MPGIIDRFVSRLSQGFVKGLISVLKKEGRYFLVKGDSGWLIDHQIGFNLADKTLLPTDYLSSGDTLLVVTTNNVLNGGVTFVTDPSRFRTVPLSPKEIETRPGDFEMNGLWLSPGLPKNSRLMFWLFVCTYLLSRPLDSRFYFSFETRKQNLEKFYKSFTEEILYEGEVKNLPGMNSSKTYTERICRTSIRHLIYRLPFVILTWIFRHTGR